MVVEGSERRPNEHRAVESGNGHPARVHQHSALAFQLGSAGWLFCLLTLRDVVLHCFAQLSVSAFVSSVRTVTMSFH